MSFYGEMFSTLGYKTLRVLLGVNEEPLIEEEKMQLTNLIILMENNPDLNGKVSEVINSSLDDQKKLEMLFILEKMARID
ncbi:hypothetical protein P5G62_006495 [Neobacillus sp. 179-C4.2 HS]|jgi:hypothetical protein|uniref:IDEAL domain-containing protein n=1 Tax=Neobacillus driksii TaxID=3035913 RepID=A0ABV4YPH9_9BACI|nr:hypothetical protein [Neobacillus sp. 179.-C4.2 HS]MDP5195586.1 hypothetical protein [Neobacillus sp. 179.-C4.2 HS]